MEIFRIVDTLWANKLTASGKASRWNSKGVDMIYFAQSASLACLENAVHRSGIELQNNIFSLVVVQAPNNFEIMNENDLPDGWDDITFTAKYLCRQFGDMWVNSNSSLLLQVPSVIIKGEYNFLVNPKHPDFSILKIIKISPFSFDKRIK